MPGYIKRVGGNVRFRFVKPGHDPNGTVAPNNVIFDSNANEYLAVHAAGSFLMPASTAFTWKASFPSLGYIPLALAVWRWTDTAGGITNTFVDQGGGGGDIQVSQTQIGADSTGTTIGLYVDFVIFRRPAA